MSTAAVGVILAGGASRRMGFDKAAVPIEGSTMLQRVATALEPAVAELVVVGRDAALPAVPAIPDDGPNLRGPLAGVATALHRFLERPLLVVAVDQPFVRTETLRRLAAVEGGDAVVPLDGGVRQATCALYRPTCRPHAGALVTAGVGSLQALLDRIDVVEIREEAWAAWGEDGRSWFSIDTVAAIDEGIARFGSEPATEEPQ